MTNYIAVNDFSGNAGATVWWSLSGNVTAVTLRDAWARHGLDARIPLPDLPSPEQRLGRAVETVKDAHTIVRPVRRSGHWAIVSESVAGTGDAATLQHSHELSVLIRPGRTEVECSEITPKTERILASYAAQEGWYHRDDLSLWLAEVIKRLHGTRLRPRGAPYYLLPDRVQTWRDMTAAFADAKVGTLYTLPTLAGDEAVSAVLDALTRDVADESDDLLASTELDGNGKRRQGVRALRARVQDCDSLLSRLASYEGLLGGALDAVRQRVVSVQDKVLAAAFAAEAEALANLAK
jgi:hypothetical protein